MVRSIRKEVESYGLRIPDSPLKKSPYRFSKKFIMSSFECYYGATDPIQHLRHYQDKMAVYSHADLFLICVFPSSLKGTAYDWFYYLPKHSLWGFEEVKHAFYNQYAFRWELKKNNNHLLTIKIKLEDSLKHYVSQSQMALVYNCNADVVAAASISGL